MKFVLPLLLASALVGGTVNVVLVPVNLQKKYQKARAETIKAGEAMAKYCDSINRQIAQNQRTGVFGCITAEPDPQPDPSQEHAEKF